MSQVRSVVRPGGRSLSYPAVYDPGSRKVQYSGVEGTEYLGTRDILGRRGGVKILYFAEGVRQSMYRVCIQFMPCQWR
jgi:hypothetical protein